MPRTDEQREHYSPLARPNVIVPEKAVDGLSLIAAADFVIGAGGTMNREAVALGTPAYTHVRRPPRRGRRAADRRGPPAPRRLGRPTWCRDKKEAAGGAQGSAAPPAARRDPQFFVDAILDLGRRGRGPVA